ncbi:DUF1385 domain-containing protein [Lysinibacillus halotolerans]|uniref:DUF1385 domain-containing protein n=1 Tax=Lysinibacillus halotolerans TaxID=1368476 RepID=A0A3M8H4M9_9BACI|nr:DUF1385 domain-containing protein [Lysinibacillus halotolerans]RNC97376.1 DUF1385 domain-containing protein [Lysinibacillus halotolerans]
MSIIKGGAARFNGVIFYSEKYISKAIRNRDGTLSINITKRKDTSKLDRVINKIPIIRGLFLLINPIIVMWKLYLFIFLPLLVLLVLMTRNSVIASGSSMLVLSIIAELIQSHFLLLLTIILVTFGVICKITNLGKYHAAEHMTDTSFSTLSSLAISDVIMQSRIHRRCGSNIVVFFFFWCYIFSFFIADLLLLGVLSVCLGYELFLIQSRMLTPFYWIGGFIQYTLFTSKPSSRHVEVAVASYEALLKAERNDNKV